MDFFQYKNLRAFAMEPLGKYIGAGSVYRTSSHMHGPAVVLEKEAKLALHLCDRLDLSPTETAAAHLLAAVTKQRTVAWCYEQETPDDCLPLAPFTVEQGKLLCDQTRQAASAYAAFLPERQAVALLALVPEPQTAPAPATDSASNAPACDLSILATREQLIEAFGRFTGMDASWFRNIKDTPALLAARKVTGQGGRSHIAEPWFCPFEVMQWLADSKRRKGRKLSTEKAWELLEKNFPKVHSAHSVADPRVSD